MIGQKHVRRKRKLNGRTLKHYTAQVEDCETDRNEASKLVYICIVTMFFTIREKLRNYKKYKPLKIFSLMKECGCGRCGGVERCRRGVGEEREGEEERRGVGVEGEVEQGWAERWWSGRMSVEGEGREREREGASCNGGSKW